MEKITLEKLLAAHVLIKQLFPEPIDDCIWINDSGWDHIRSQSARKEVNCTTDFAGMKVYIDNSLKEIQTGTYAVIDGVPTKVVRHIYQY